MASTAPPSRSAAGVGNPKPRLRLFDIAKKHKQSFVQLFAITGVFMLSMRSLGQKYQLRELEGDIEALREERDQTADRMDRIRTSLLEEADRDSTGELASRLRRLFGEGN